MKKDVNFVLCLDVTGDMVHIIDDVREKTFCYLSGLADKVRREEYGAGNLYVTVVEFRDVDFDFEVPLAVSRRFLLPEEKRELKSYLDSIKTAGGGDIPESGVEALAEAKKYVNADCFRNAIVLITSAPCKLPYDEGELHAVAENIVSFPTAGYRNAIAVVSPDCDEWKKFESEASGERCYYLGLYCDEKMSDVSEKIDWMNSIFDDFLSISD